MLPTLASLQGCWTRSRLAWPDGRLDVTSAVTWLQGPILYADLRQPHGLAEGVAGVPSLRALTRDQVLLLAEQEGFAGPLIQHPDASFEWQRTVDFQPPRTSTDRGFLDDAGSLMIETGHAEPYIEHWHRSDGAVLPCAALQMADENGGRAALVRVGRDFIFARARTIALVGGDLRAHVVAAATLEAAQDLIDCEISLGTVTDGTWRIARSTLPYRVGSLLAPQSDADGIAIADVDPWGKPIVRRWGVTAREGGLGEFAAGPETP